MFHFFLAYKTANDMTLSGITHMFWNTSQLATLCSGKRTSIIIICSLVQVRWKVARVFPKLVRLYSFVYMSPQCVYVYVTAIALCGIYPVQWKKTHLLSGYIIIIMYMQTREVRFYTALWKPPCNEKNYRVKAFSVSTSSLTLKL